MADKVIVNCETGKERAVPFTAAEKREREKDVRELEERERASVEARQRREQARASGLTKLKDLGLDEEEIAALNLAES